MRRPRVCEGFKRHQAMASAEDWTASSRARASCREDSSRNQTAERFPESRRPSVIEMIQADLQLGVDGAALFCFLVWCESCCGSGLYVMRNYALITWWLGCSSV